MDLPTPKQPTHITYKIETINKVLQYLSSRPYAEVFQLVAAIQSEGKVQEESEDAPKSE